MDFFIQDFFELNCFYPKAEYSEPKILQDTKNIINDNSGE